MSIQSAPQEGIRIGRDVSRYNPDDRGRVLHERQFGMVTVWEESGSEVVFCDQYLNEAPKDTSFPGIELHTKVQMHIEGVPADPMATGTIDLMIPQQPESILFVDKDLLFDFGVVLAERLRRTVNPASRQNRIENVANLLATRRFPIAGRHVDLVVATDHHPAREGDIEMTYCKVAGRDADGLQGAQSIRVSPLKQIESA